MKHASERPDPVDRYVSHRRFQVWAYTVSMGQLLLRSTKSESVPTRVDVLFQNVRWMNVPATMNGLEVTRVDDRTFRLAGAGWEGTVEAGVMIVAEDDGAFSDPSPLYVGGVGS